MRQSAYIVGGLICIGIIAGILAARPTDNEGLRKSDTAARTVYLLYETGRISQPELSAVKLSLQGVRAVVAAEPVDDLPMQLGGYVENEVNPAERRAVNNLIGQVGAQDIELLSTQRRYMMLLALDGILEAIAEVERSAP